MTPEELLKPRYKVIADYPGNDEYPLGSIKENIGESYCRFLNEYPHLFKKLEWREDRDITDMPQYLKYLNEDGEIDFVLKVEKYIPSEVRGNQYWAFEYKWQNEPDIKRMSLQGWTPATEEEYLNTIKPH